MKVEYRIVKAFAAMALICGLSVSAQAQLGSGWTPDNETYNTQTSAGCTVTPISGGFEFSVPSGHGRAELRGNDLPSNTTNQWQGFATLTSFPSGSDKICMHQVFGPYPSTPDLILDEATYTGGIEIMSLEQSDAFEAQIQVGVQFQLNTIYDPAGKLITIYVNGSQTGTKTPNSGVHYNKYGQYVSGSGNGPSTMDWVNVQSWAGGTVTPPQFYTITTSAVGFGTISPSVTVASGASAIITISPDGSYSVATLTVDGVSVPPVTSYTFNDVVANHTISATFGKGTPPPTFTITTSAGANGTISPSVTVASGGSATITIMPNAGYMVNTLTVDGASVPAATSYTFNDVVANHTISATFAPGTSVAAPTFSEPAGTYKEKVKVKIADVTSGVTISYTTDGSTPTETNGTVYSKGSLEFRATTTLQAVAYTSSGISNVTSATYTITPKS